MATPRENKFKAFFRSRSRSRTQPSDPLPDPLPLPARPHHLTPRDTFPSENPPSSYIKSSLRSQNRPISTTTTATHSTITPLPSDSLRNRPALPRHAYAYHPRSTDTHTSIQDHDQCSDTCDDDSDDNRFPRSETPSSTRRKLLWHSFFGISLTRRSSSSTSTPHPSSHSTNRNGSTSTSTSDPRIHSPRKRSFRLTSRPTTPKSVDSTSSKSPYAIPVPSSPLPLSASPRRRSFGLGSSQRTTPKSSAGHLPLPQVQNPQQGRAHGRRHSVGSERPPHDSAVALPEEPSHRTIHKSVPNGAARNKGKEKEKLFAGSERPPGDLRPSLNVTSQSLPSDPSPISRKHLPSHSFPRPTLFPNLPTVDSASSEENDHSSHRLHVIPQIIHTPPTPQRPGEEADTPSPSTTALPRVDPGKAVTIAHREHVLVSSSQSHTDPHHALSTKGRFRPRFLTTKDVPKAKDSNGQKSNRRLLAGSHDPASKTPGPVRNMTNHQGKLGSFDFERPVSGLNRSCSTVDRQNMHTPDNASYPKFRVHALERTTSDDSARDNGNPRLNGHDPGQAESPALSQIGPDHMGATSVISFSSVSLQTKSTGIDIGSNATAGQSSSWGRASGRRILRTSHGTFAFEHPSSLPNTPNPHTFNLPSESNQNDTRERTVGSPQPKPRAPLHAMFDTRVKHSRGQSYNTSDQPSYPNPRERKPKCKGRSLDLGLGLSWAPSRLREEVLMPGLILAREKEKVEKDKANGLDVTQMFESILSEARFQTFKKYVRRFDAHTIPLEGSSGLLARVENLLAESGLSERERSKLMSEFTAFVENHDNS